MNWGEFKKISEREFRYLELYGNVAGYQMQPGTRWKNGLSEINLRKLENLFGFIFPKDYREYLKVMNGIDTDLISIDPDGIEEDTFFQFYYEYPNDFDRSKELLDEIEKYIDCVHGALGDVGFNINEIEGFVPTYAHRALVAFKDKSVSPVVSVWGGDVVVLAENIIDYWIKKFNLEHCF